MEFDWERKVALFNFGQVCDVELFGVGYLLSNYHITFPATINLGPINFVSHGRLEDSVIF